jgi:ribonucleoside-diphosphate reductase alpha chain
MVLTENALTVLRARYLLKDEDGQVMETPPEMFRRVARHVASAEAAYGEAPAYWEERFYELMSDLSFLPNSPTLMNAGKDIGQLAACFVLPVEDSMTGIFETLKNAALILQSGGGTGFSFSHLRPKADIVRSTGGIASGPVSFMKIYNTATEVIKQGGARRGANMGILRVDHPDIMEFIRLKRDARELTNFNISVAVTDVFMDAVVSDSEYDLVSPRGGSVTGGLRAREVFDEIIRSAHDTGDPGVVFIDRINSANPTPLMGTLESTNPCGEQPLLPYEACVLGSLNLSRFVKDGKVDYEGLAGGVSSAVRFLDDCIDVNRYPLPEIERMHKGNRKIGLGVMGWADMLIDLGVPYQSGKALRLAEEVMGFIRDRAREASSALARKKGAFPNFKGSIYDTPGMPMLRNATLTTIAPTGTLSILADCSSGIEPLYALSYKRLVLNTELYEMNGRFIEMARQGVPNEGELLEQVRKKGTLRGIKGLPPEIKKLFKTAHEIPPRTHIRMQAAFQRHTDNAVSKTVNLPMRAGIKDVERVYLLAYEMGCKGITVFRQGSRKKGALLKLSDTD